MSISMIGLDTAKSVFQIHGVNETGKVELRRKLRRSELIAFFEKQESCTVVMEACGASLGAHPHRSRPHGEVDCT
jgi:transposase